MYVTRPNRSTASGLKYEVLGLGGYLPMHTCTRTRTHTQVYYLLHVSVYSYRAEAEN